MPKSGWKFFKRDQVKLLTNDAQRLAVFNTLVTVAADARQRVPVETGRLERSQSVVMDKKGSPRGVVQFGGGRGTGKRRVFYATLVHEQPSKGHNYLRDPFEELAEPTFVREIQAQMRDKGLL
jgi:hypothetical protein